MFTALAPISFDLLPHDPFLAELRARYGAQAVDDIRPRLPPGGLDSFDLSDDGRSDDDGGADECGGEYDDEYDDGYDVADYEGVA